MLANTIMSQKPLCQSSTLLCFRKFSWVISAAGTPLCGSQTLRHFTVISVLQTPVCGSRRLPCLQKILRLITNWRTPLSRLWALLFLIKLSSE